MVDSSMILTKEHWVLVKLEDTWGITMARLDMTTCAFIGGGECHALLPKIWPNDLG
jgi:hypothetical protein